MRHNRNMLARKITVLSLIALFALGLAQDVFSPARTYVLAEKDVYGLSMRLDAGQYMVSISGKMNYVVKKVHENGDADVESRVTDMTLDLLGQTTKQPDGDARVVRYNKFGAPIERVADKNQKQPVFMNFLTYRTNVPMKVGETIKVDETLEDAAKTQIKGTAKLESITDGVAKIASQLEIIESKNKKPTKIASVGYFDVKTSKLNRSEAKLTDVDPNEMQGLPPISSITVVIEREK